MTSRAKKLTLTRLRHAKFISTLIIYLPFTRAVVLTGSLANNSSNENSDIDLLIISKGGRIFTARFLSLLIVWVTGLKRSSKPNADSSGKICLNYFLTDGFLIIPHHRSKEINLYCAKSYYQSKLLAGDWAVFEKFMSMNHGWMAGYLKSQISNKSLREGRGFGGRRSNLKQFNNFTVKQFSEKLLSGLFGQKIENYLKQVQLRRIQKDPRTKMFPDFIYADDREMRFHPPKGS